MSVQRNFRLKKWANRNLKKFNGKVQRPAPRKDQPHAYVSVGDQLAGN